MIHVLGICGTFMGGLALLAREMGHSVSGCDENVYPPMSTQLENAGIQLMNGYLSGHLSSRPDQVVVGNFLRRGFPIVETLLNQNIPYTSGPQWLAENILKDRWVLAVSGTHGKTTVSSMLAWILEFAGLQPGFLIGGVPGNFGVSARLGAGRHFVVEADEYDTAFFDKRSKFVHYRPRTLVINNIEFDHADIFPDLAAIQRQFHHLVRTVPGEGWIITPSGQPTIQKVLEMGCWTPVEYFGDGRWQARPLKPDCSVFECYREGVIQGQVHWSMSGVHNMLNALAAIAAADHAGVHPGDALAALAEFQGIKRRMELRGEVNGITVYDDFAHHPTAIAATLTAARAGLESGKKLIGVVEMRSNTMKMGVFKDRLKEALNLADQVVLYKAPGLQWDLSGFESPGRCQVQTTIDGSVEAVCGLAEPGTRIMVMSNGGFGNIHQRLLDALGALG